MFNLILGIILILQVLGYGYLSGFSLANKEGGKALFFAIFGMLLAFIGIMNLLVAGSVIW